MKNLSIFKNILYIIIFFLLDSGLAATWKLFDETDMWIIPKDILAANPKITPQAFVWNISVACRAFLIYMVMFTMYRIRPLDFLERLFLYACAFISAVDILDSYFNFNQRVTYYEWTMWVLVLVLIIYLKYTFRKLKIRFNRFEIETEKRA